MSQPAANLAPAHSPDGDAATHEHQPYVAPSVEMPELTLRALVLGAVLGIIFAASSVYLALKVGMTVSASIPVAVLSITIFRALGKAFGRPATILENNIAQTTGSAGESIAFGVAITIPALLLMGYDIELLQVLTIASLGGLLGVLMMIPLRYGLIVKEHGNLTYPEGTACADVLIVGEQGGTNARTVFSGFGIGLLYKFLNAGLRLWQDVPERALGFFRGASVAAEISPELIGVGYIIGVRISAVTFAGGVLAYLVIIPAITFFGTSSEAIFPGTKPISQMSPHEIRNAYVLYIGAGAVATGGIISLIRSLPTIVNAFRAGIKTFVQSRQGSAPTVERTARDLPITVVVLGSVALVLVIWLSPHLGINLVSALLILLFGFFFVTVSSRICGQIGSSSNPISGMTVATLLITCLLFLAVGWTGVSYRALALSTAAIVCIAASNGGTTSQDLKTGFLVGATPARQQLALMVGVLSSAAVIGFVLIYLNNIYTTVAPRTYPGLKPDVVTEQVQKAPDGQDYRVAYVRESGGQIPQGKYLVDGAGEVRFVVDPGIGGTVSEVDGRKTVKLDAPKARLMSLIIDGILTQKLPWALVLLGIFIALMMELAGVPSLPFAVGLYLPISSSAPIMVGGLVRYLVDRRTRTSEAEAEFSPGVLLASGYIAGGAICGLLVAALA
ncbi:MAG: oligopeptide transporter, OPT family, partial [Myxococcota bacterium]